MTKEKQFIKDAAAYLRVVGETDDYRDVIATLAHDIMGLDQKLPCFLPRVSGYADAENKSVEGTIIRRRK